ncbi:dmX-like protein 2 isoform X3 [Anthonomus grandis grandis]|uniref:dmX-like protein 2 isoform X3 n=1 Tax=Anthonomus grandis grandis TaxID=2921223 RepID=UPI0021662ED5|nr:dmX-like protein 2 isoform X3 [Anthonomus grandis grandis]
MNLHQIVSGACNAGDKCFAVGSVEGVPFTAYAAGCNIVILASTFERVQIIPGAVHDYIRISSIDCSCDTGKIAAAYENTVCIYEPTPLIHNNSPHGLDYRWVQTGTLKTDAPIRALSWNLEGTRLLTAGSDVQLWHLKQQIQEETPVTFTLGEGAEDGENSEEPDKPQEQEQTLWQCVWKATTAADVQHLAFSPDGTLFATCGENDRLVKIWYENKHFLFTSKSTDGHQELDYGFVYIAHPRAVTHVSWRNTSKYMPKGSVSNMLLTSCKDNICRLWVETVLPEDGLVNLSQLDPQAHHPKFRTHRHKHRFMQRLKHMKTCFHIRRNAKHHAQGIIGSSQPIPTLPSTYSVHDFHSYGYHGTGVTPGLHFHLAASVNAETDIPLVPNISFCNPRPAFVLHWLDNKEMQFSLQAELFLEEFARPVVDNPESEENALEPLMEAGGADGVDARIESFLRDWHHSPDLLFSIHPVDGSFLIWVVEWLDEFHPGSFRQAQVSFSTRIPSAFPIGDSMSMSTTVSLYSTTPLVKHLVKEAVHREYCNRNLNSVKEEDENKSDLENACLATDQNDTEPGVYLVTKHDNGTLNLWHLTFADQSKFAQVLSIGHRSRASGHRFRVNDITCHPVLPLLLTTSHHNIVDQKNQKTNGFCSELILWKVDAVGPLSKSGGICELARISSPEPAAFSNVAWIPTLLPSSTLGNLSNSPSACFVASDGQCLRVYQAVIDARTLLADLAFKESRQKQGDHDMSDISDMSSYNEDVLLENINIVSQQSTSRPGCIIQLETIAEAIQWQNTTFLHVYQEQLITGQRSSTKAANQDAMVDLQQSSVFEEPFYIVLLDCTEQNTIIHTWKLTIASTDIDLSLTASQMYVPDCNLVQDENDLSRRNSIESLHLKQAKNTPHITLTIQREIKQILPLPDAVEIVHATPAAGHLSSASIYPACLAPYCFATACSDGIIRFWAVSTLPQEVNELTRLMLEEDGVTVNTNKVWAEWNMVKESAIEIEGQVLNISVAYSGRLACAYKYGKSFTRPNKADQDSRYINLCVAIYECESTGGTEWILEDVIHLKNIHLPRIDINKHLDLSYLYDSRTLKKKQRLNEVLHTLSDDRQSNMLSTESIKPTLLAVPSFTTLQSLRKSISEIGNICPLTQKHIVQLDWVSNEDGSHILTVACGSKILLYTPLSTDLAQANVKAMKESMNNFRPILRKASSLAQPMFVDDFKWMALRKIELHTADGLPALPMQISWVRDGILVVGMDSEMHVYTQWKPQQFNQKQDGFSEPDSNREIDFRTLTQENQRKLAAVSTLGRISSVNLQILERKRTKEQNLDYMPDYGLFEASRIACPVLPQYHPKQLMELLNSGKIRWVKAILAHLVKFIGGNQELSEEIQGWARSRTLSVSYPAGSPEHRASISEITLDYDEASNIPPLPLWTLLAADKELRGVQEEKKDYNELFDNVISEESLDNILDEDEDVCVRERRPSEKNVGLTHFTPKQGRILSRLLTHMHLPGLSSLDQMHLLALADTVANCDTDLAERFAIDAAKSAMVKENLITQNEEVLTESLDDCGLRFLLAMKHYNYLLRCLPLVQRNQFQKQGVGNNNLAWAFHSESQEELLNLIPSYAKGEPTWTQLRELGVGWWVRNLNLLRQCVQIMAKAAYQAEQDPMDAALYYLAMRKKNLLWGLYRSKRDQRMTDFFSNNFTEDRWRKAALKNAYALLGKQRFEHAAAFFLLAGNLKDAVEICIHKIEDIQMAIIITRLYEGDGESLKKLLYKEILGCDENGENEDLTRAHPDPFLRSMALWALKDYQAALSTLLIGNAGTQHPSHDEEIRETKEADPNVFNFYVYLRTHPLLVRQHLTTRGQRKVWKDGKQIIAEDYITPLERQLYFATAHGHFRAGCPALALEVLSKLPHIVPERLRTTPLSVTKSQNSEAIQEIATGIISWDEKTPSQSVTDFDWSAPVNSGIKTDDLELKWSDDEGGSESDDSGGLSMKIGGNKEEKPETLIKEQTLEEEREEEAQNQVDIMAQQLKFIACLKILMEELSTLATGFEVDGGQLRYQLYLWLEKEVEALRELCNYTAGDLIESSDLEASPEPENQVVECNPKPTLHEILVQEKLDFEAKVQRAAKRKRWLRANETLLRTLLSYCSLHGATGGLASVRMELMLLLQELQQEKTHQQLLSPLPFPTSLPLLAASVASSKTVIADPIRYLQSLTHDMLQTMVELRKPQTNQSQLLVLRDLAIALSACIYQSLCDSDTFKASVQDSQDIASTFLVGRKRKISVNESQQIVTLPAKWPGVTSLRALLAREKDEDTPRLTVLLCEAFTATFLALLLYGLVTCDCVILFHVTAHNLDTDVWGKLFGGGIKKLLRTASLTSNQTGNALQTQVSVQTPSEESSGPANWLSKQRIKLNTKLLGPQSSIMKEDKPTYREQFVPPQISILAFLVQKPDTQYYVDEVESENEDEEEDEDVFEGNTTTITKNVNNEHSDPNSYSWLVLKLATLKIVHNRLIDFLGVAGLETSELPVASPLIHSALRSLTNWQENLKRELELREVPPEYIPGCFVESSTTGPPIQKYRQLLEPHNTPFSTKSSASSARMLWNYLVHQESVQEIFIRAVFGNKRRSTVALEEVIPHSEPSLEPVRIIHKEQDCISAFSLNHQNSGMIVVATPRELQEMDISLLLELPSWLEDECELDILNLTKDCPDSTVPPFLVIQSVGDKSKDTQPSSPQPGMGSQSGRGASVPQIEKKSNVQVLKHKMDGVRRITSHPLLPLYLTGGTDGSVHLWEWGHQQPVATPRPAGTYAKVTRLRFSQHGNKFGVADSDGILSLFQVGLSANATWPFFTHNCHNKGISDFVFLGSCSLLATAGHSSENKNVCIWDSIMPHNKALVMAFTCHDQGSSSLVFAPQHQLLISAGKKGDVCLIDVRSKAIRHKFAAHESSVKCLAIDPHEDYFATGSADGDIKIWGVAVPNVLLSLPAEHARGSFFKNIGQGVTQIQIDSHSRLFSCGADGSMKVRQLPDRETLLNHHH